jgi:dTDP-glucose 4,6-dehydratase
VEDCCEAIYALLSEGAWGEYNVGAGNQPEIKNRQMAEMLVEVFGTGFDQIEHIPDPRPKHDFRYAVNTDRIFKTVGWSPRWSLSQALKTTLDWYQKNEIWWRKRIADADSLYAEKEKK